MTTRLDRLILLLDTGSTPTVRLTAARQLGQIAGQRVGHGRSGETAAAASAGAGAAGGGVEKGEWRGVDGEWDEVVGLLMRVLPHLRSKSHDTRTAASQAIESIVKSVGIWDPIAASSSSPIGSSSQAFIEEDEKPEHQDHDHDHDHDRGRDRTEGEIGGRMRLETFDLLEILRSGKKLLSSAGREFEHLQQQNLQETPLLLNPTHPHPSGGGGGGGAGEGLGRVKKELGFGGFGGVVRDEDLGMDLDFEEELMEGERQFRGGGGPATSSVGGGVVVVDDTAGVRVNGHGTGHGISTLPPPKFAPSPSLSTVLTKASTTTTIAKSKSKSPSPLTSTPTPTPIPILTTPPPAPASLHTDRHHTLPHPLPPPPSSDAGGEGGASNLEGLSARERNQLKRKRKLMEKSGSVGSVGAGAGGSVSMGASFSAGGGRSATLGPGSVGSGGELEGSGNKVRIISKVTSSPPSTDDLALPCSSTPVPIKIDPSTPPPPPSTTFTESKPIKVEPTIGDGTEDGAGAAPALGSSSDKVIIDPQSKAAAAKSGEAEGEAQTGDFVGGSQKSLDPTLWPFEGFVRVLIDDLENPVWEIRHGCCLGLREVVRWQGFGAGMVAGLTKAENEKRHKGWTDNLAFRLLKIFAVDRFGDFVSDQVIAPVRETASQTLASLLLHMPKTSIFATERILVEMVRQDWTSSSSGGGGRDRDRDRDLERGRKVEGGLGYVWEVRHSGLLGLKYLVAVTEEFLRGDGDDDAGGEVKAEVVKEEEGLEGGRMDVDGVEHLGGRMLRAVVDAALIGLRDQDDDVRAAAAATLLPIADTFVSKLPGELQNMIDVLWDCLGDLKDDLSSSVGGVMDLLAKLMSFPPVLELMQSSREGRGLSDLVPRLYPFFRHTITAVRLAVQKALVVFLSIPSPEKPWVDEHLLRLLFQNLIVEDRLDIRNATDQAWTLSITFLGTQSAEVLERISRPAVDDFFRIMMSLIGTPMESRLFWSYSGPGMANGGGVGGGRYNVDKAVMAQDLALVSVESLMRGRVGAAVALGLVMSYWPDTTRENTFEQYIKTYLQSSSALHRFMSATLIEEWARASVKIGKATHPTFTEFDPLAQKLALSIVPMIESDSFPDMTEMNSVLSRLQADCQSLLNAFVVSGKVKQAAVPVIPTPFQLSNAQDLVQTQFEALVPQMGRGTKKTALPGLEERKRKIIAAIGYYEAAKGKHDVQVFAALGGAAVALMALPSKLNPLIRSIMNSIKYEENLDLQTRSARSIATFIDACSSPDAKVRVNPTDKIVGNLCTFLCQDVSQTPLFGQSKNVKDTIFTLKDKPARGLAVKEVREEVVESEDAVKAKLNRRGAQAALSQLAERFGENVLERMPKLWSCMTEALTRTFSQDVQGADATMQASDVQGQNVLDCLTVLPAVVPSIHPSLRDRIAPLFATLATAARSKFPVVRQSVSRCYASLCEVMPSEGLMQVVRDVVPILGDPLNSDHRRGAIEVISHIVQRLDIQILPYVIFLVVPVLGRMSDSDDDVRLMATNTFASLIKLVPLEAGLPDPPGFSAELISKREDERQFLTQLLDGRKVQTYEIPIKIKADLRKYQREGISWLAFLAKYQLHGILCDDMGLGKTLQSICILASKIHERAEVHKKTKSPDSVHLPSLVVCPPTLTGHWFHEIKTYADNLRPLLYTGTPAERTRLHGQMKKSDAVITSYEVVRKDIDYLSKIDWNYCILDEGHIIKNGRTKLTKAVKMIRANHRLILSGTPIQNNVLELWSLFDFLMPGFLGSEKAFNERFGKPILASRDAKSSSKEQEAGALALEALHKQVLPFLMRRLKEDVLDDLPPKIIQDYYCELSPMQKDLYESFSKSQARDEAESDLAAESDAGKGEKQHIFQALQYLRKLVNHPALVFKPGVQQHQEVLKKFEKSEGGGILRDISVAPKLQALKQILADCGIGAVSSSEGDATDSSAGAVSPHRVLIFCQLKQMLDIIENDLFRSHLPSITYMRLDGTTPANKRHAVVQTFNADPSIDVLLLTTHVGGLGLNLTGADTVVFVEHDWNPMKDLQAMDRAHRLGQKRVVNVYRLITRGTLEEKIMGLQRFKLNIASSIVTQQNSDISSMDTDQILDLFTISSSEDDAARVKQKAKDGPASQKNVLEGLESLHDEREYDSFDVGKFAASLKG